MFGQCCFTLLHFFLFVQKNCFNWKKRNTSLFLSLVVPLHRSQNNKCTHFIYIYTVALRTHAIHNNGQYFLFRCCFASQETKFYSSYQMHLHFSCVFSPFHWCSFNINNFLLLLLLYISILFSKENSVCEYKCETKSLLWYASFSSACFFFIYSKKL